MDRADTQAIELLRGLSLQTDDLHVHSFLQDAAYHLSQHATPAPDWSLYARLKKQSN